ncbi:MAG: hypothetical protein ISS25_03700 [Nanoarchaeota archaeon]|nr:hypothetical protein [DPANN group archaeon]MBL7116907.1 hypothetical protein [Nanoarchaeota archaeon]
MRKPSLSLLLIVLLAPLISAQNTPITVSLEVIDSPESAVSVPVFYSIHSSFNDETVEGRTMSDSEGFFTLDVFPGFHELIVSIDESNTEGYDFFGKISFFANDSTDVSVALFPVGSAKVIVVDDSNRPVPAAPVRIDCSRSYGVQGYFRTDEFGIVSADYLPIGECIFRSAIEDIVVSLGDNITIGSHQEITLRMNGYQLKKNNFIEWILAIIIIITILFMLYRAVKVNKKIVMKEEKEEKKEVSSGKEDILTALGKKEQEVVKYLLEQKEKSDKKDFYVSQANIVHGAGMPKTSLVRVLNSLEQKNILKIEKIGKLKKISFTEWFDSK